MGKKVAKRELIKSKAEREMTKGNRKRNTKEK